MVTFVGGFLWCFLLLRLFSKTVDTSGSGSMIAELCENTRNKYHTYCPGCFGWVASVCSNFRSFSSGTISPLAFLMTGLVGSTSICFGWYLGFSFTFTNDPSLLVHKTRILCSWNRSNFCGQWHRVHRFTLEIYHQRLNWLTHCVGNLIQEIIYCLFADHGYSI